jgi:hypothetical protein
MASIPETGNNQGRYVRLSTKAAATLDRSENYRALARELIKLAHAATAGDLRSEFLELAERYDRLADAVEDGTLAPGPAAD